MEFRYPILIEAPGGYAVPMRASPAGKDAAPPPNDNLLLIAANGWNLDDVVNVKQGRVKNLAESAQFQQRMRANAGDAAIQIYANLNHGFGYAYMTLLGELYGLPIGGTPLEEHLLPRSECFGPLGHLWISLSREKLPDPPPPAAAGKSSRLRFRIVWIMD